MNIKDSFQIHGLHEAGKNHEQLAAQLGISRGQVGYSQRRGTVSPKKIKGLPLILKADDVSQIISYVESSPENRRQTFLELASGPSRHLGVSERVVQRDLGTRGYRRYVAHRKPWASQKTTWTRRKSPKVRRQWAIEDWASIHGRSWATSEAEAHATNLVTAKLA